MSVGMRRHENKVSRHLGRNQRCRARSVYVLKPSNGLHFKDAKNALYDRVAKKHEFDFIDALIDCEIARFESEDSIDEEY